MAGKEHMRTRSAATAMGLVVMAGCAQIAGYDKYTFDRQESAGTGGEAGS